MSDQTSRRHILAALSGAAFAGSALVLAMPTEVPAVVAGPGADAELILLIARFDALEQRIWGNDGSETFEEEMLRDAANEPLRLEQGALLERICSMPTHTLEGLRARARSFLAWDDEDCPESCQKDRMVAAILRGLVGGNPGKSTSHPAASVIDAGPSPDGDLIRTCSALAGMLDTYEACEDWPAPDVEAAYGRTLDAIDAVRPQTVAGMIAKAKAAIEHARRSPGFDVVKGDRSTVAEGWAWDLLHDLLRLSNAAGGLT